MVKATEKGRSKWIRVGSISVETGALLLADPVLALSEEGRNALRVLFERTEKQRFSRISCRFVTDDEHEIYQTGLVADGCGEGEFPVWVRISKDGRVIEMSVRFDENFEFANDHQ